MHAQLARRSGIAAQPSHSPIMKTPTLLLPLRALSLFLGLVPCVGFAVDDARKPALDIGSRWELFVDEFLIAGKTGVALKLHDPIRREIVLTTDQPWEGHTCAYFSALQD